MSDLAFTPERRLPPNHLKSNLLASVSFEEPRIRRTAIPLRSRLRQLTAPLAAVLAVMALGTTAYLASQIQDLTASQEALEARASRQREAIQFLISDRLVTVSLQPELPWPLASGRIYLVPGEALGMLAVENMPPLPVGRSYQLWLLADADRDNGGLIRVDSSGNGYLVIRAPRPLSQYTAVGITDEPEGGSAAPTGNRIIGGSL